MKLQALTTCATLMLATLSTAAGDCRDDCSKIIYFAWCVVKSTGFQADCLLKSTKFLFVTGSRGVLQGEPSPSVRLDQTFFGNMTALDTITFSHVHVSAVDASAFFAFPALRSLSLVDTGVRELPEDLVARAPSLVNLTVTGNLTGVPGNAFANNPLLSLVDLSRNSLASLPAGLFSRNGLLSAVLLDRNSLASLPASTFGQCPQLRAVSLSHNKLATLPADLFAGNPLLEKVNLTGNSLTSLPEALFRRNGNLKHVSLVNNRLASVSSEVFPGNALNGTLRLGGNPLSCDCRFRGHVTRLTEMRWAVDLPPRCEIRMNVDCSASRARSSSSSSSSPNLAIAISLYVGVVGWTIGRVAKDLLRKVGTG